MRFAVILIALLPASAWAEDWVRLLNDAAVEQAIAGRTVVYDEYTLQQFGAAGDTQFITERASSGRWAARGGQYCSVWPPSDVWTCYDLQLNGDRIRFIASDRSVSEGVFQQ